MLDELARWGVSTSSSTRPGRRRRGADLVWLEAPSNPFLTMPDFEAAAAHPGLVVCDSTAATPLHVRPLERGCDIALHSATKYLAGHDDALRRRGRVRATGRRRAPARVPLTHGPRPDADTAWLLLRGLETLEVRVARQTETRARARASGSARIPPSRPSATPASAGSSPSTSRTATPLGGSRRATRLIANMTSLGGVTSRIEARSRWEGDARPARPPAALGRPRGCRGALGRPRAGARDAPES